MITSYNSQKTIIPFKKTWVFTCSSTVFPELAWSLVWLFCLTKDIHQHSRNLGQQYLSFLQHKIQIPTNNKGELNLLKTNRNKISLGVVGVKQFLIYYENKEINT